MHAGKFIAAIVLLTSGVLATACGPGSSGFDFRAGEAQAIRVALTGQSCVEHGELSICPTASEATQGNDEAPSIELNALSGGFPTFCFLEGTEVFCEFDLAFVPLGFPSDANFRVAARLNRNDANWTIGGEATPGFDPTEDSDDDGTPDCQDPCIDADDPDCGGRCSTDSDLDGIPDCEDPCIWNPDPPTDTDGDGIADCVDYCGLDPQNRCTDRCTRDSDGDGENDCQDRCPFDARPNLGGDTDGDGTADCLDRCPEDADDSCTPEDRDNDGLPDFEDPCPDDDYNFCLTLCGDDVDGDGWAFCEDFCPTDDEERCFVSCFEDADEDGLYDCDDPCPFLAQFLDDVVLDLPAGEPVEELSVQIAVLVFPEGGGIGVPSSVNLLSDTGAAAAYVTDVVALQLPEEQCGDCERYCFDDAKYCLMDCFYLGLECQDRCDFEDDACFEACFDREDDCSLVCAADHQVCVGDCRTREEVLPFECDE